MQDKNSTAGQRTDVRTSSSRRRWRSIRRLFEHLILKKKKKGFFYRFFSGIIRTEQQYCSNGFQVHIMTRENRVIFLLIPKLPSALDAGVRSPLHSGRKGEELPVPTEPLLGVEPHSVSPELITILTEPSKFQVRHPCCVH
jgi:hypothetical protein